MTNSPIDPGDYNITLSDIKTITEQYILQPVTNALTNQQQILDESFALVSANKNLLKDNYERIAAVYADAKTVFETMELDELQKQDLLYPIYNEYFSIISILSWRKRRAIKADRLIRRMKKCLKQNVPKNSHIIYWLRFCQICVPLCIVFIITEIKFLNLLQSNAAFWQTGIAFLAFAASFGAYFYFLYHIEGLRLFGDLQQWIRYLKNPQGNAKPIGIVQVLKLVLAPLATIVSAIIKIYFQ